MRKLLLIICLMCLCIRPVSAMEFTAPSAPEAAERYMPQDTESFSKGLWYIIKSAVTQLQPSVASASSVCISIIAVVILSSVLQNFPLSKQEIPALVGAVAIGVILIQPTNAMIHLGTDTIQEITAYGKLLLPVMTGALAAQGGTTASAALYSGTIFFDTILSSLITQVIVPMLYVFLCLCIAKGVLTQEVINDIRKTLKWLITWSLKIILYVFTGYISITGVISGSADATIIKATKLTISGAVPVVGNILSDASEAILVSAGVMKNAVGIYGLLALAAMWIGPFLQIGVQYLMLKLTAAISEVIGCKPIVGIIKDFSLAMGIILAMIGTVSLLFLISTVCFMKGVS